MTSVDAQDHLCGSEPRHHSPPIAHNGAHQAVPSHTMDKRARPDRVAEDGTVILPFGRVGDCNERRS
jgi:hypothetical protein